MLASLAALPVRGALDISTMQRETEWQPACLALAFRHPREACGADCAAPACAPDARA